MHSRAFAIVTGLAALVAMPTMSIGAPLPHYVISMQMHDGAKLVGAPRVEVLAGHAAHIEVGSTPGNHYSMSLVVTPQQADIVSIASKLDIVSGGAHRAISPKLTVAIGKPSAIAFGDDSATSKPFRVDFTVARAA